MTIKIDLKLSLSANNAVELLLRIVKSPPFCTSLPTVITVDYFEEHEGSSDWIDKWTSSCRYHVMAEWGDDFEDEYNEGWLSYDRKFDIIKVQISDYELTDIQSIIEMIAPLPWTLAEFTRFHQKWRDESGKKYVPPGFDNGHFGHGWACAFKGKGHNCLVSRRWLEYNPWHLIRDEEHDISFIQFHELDANPEEALSQAKLGHERMGFSDIGGFIRRDRLLKLEESNAEDATVIYSDEGEEVGRGYLVDGGYNYEYFPQGLYNSNENKIEIVFVERELTERELLECCMIRYFQDLGTDKPVDKVAYVFVVPEEAQQHLHQLWLREIECWTFTEKGLKIRLDEDYQPTYEHPEWVKQLRQKQQQQEQQAKLDRVTTRLSQIKTEMKRLDDRIKNLSGGSYDRALHTRIKELKAKSSKLIGEKNQLEREKADLEQEIDQNNHK